ncbi:SAM-dependent methyltransferase [Sinorhizobium sp. A49]|uniref:class I SAM-dependent methyltransferase n=1 Tax=Sinorhizobium sp. A49 TaxID=1945861 RepID=UPI00098430E7|nr:class I SAM-dependent methyltransferase [Sinorhizobium sp. A49]OOG66577.1 SAM-dependent methyltransferase [Sinorhizobium sp. A49]
MSTETDARFWNRTSRAYAAGKIADRAGYERTLERTRALLTSSDRVLELGCGTGTTALRLAGYVHSYVATDISTEMIAIAEKKRAADSVLGLSFRTATADMLSSADMQFDVVIGFNYLHLVRDLPGTLGCIRALLGENGLLISKTPCVGDMNPLIRHALLPAMRALGKAPYAGIFRAVDLCRIVCAAGFDVVATEGHATKGNDNRPYIVARKR